MTDQQEAREVTFFTQAARRPLRFSEGPNGEKMPFHASGEQMAAVAATLIILGVVAWLADPILGWIGKALMILGGVVVYHLVAALQAGGNSPTVAAHNAWYASVSWMVRRLRRFERPERFHGRTRIVRGEP